MTDITEARRTETNHRERIGALVRTAVVGSTLLIVAVAVAAGSALLSISAVASLDLEPQLATPTTLILEQADGRPLMTRGTPSIPAATREDLPDHLVHAVLSIEDRRFYSHWGVDPVGISRALVRNIAAGRTLEGGSTITQQLVKLTSAEADRTLSRKVREALTAVWLEWRLSKDDILVRYLNRVYFGAGAHGIAAAAKIYFDKEPASLSVAESAMLAGFIRAPSRLNAFRNPVAAKRRAAVVLDAMVANGFLDAEAAERAKAEPAQTADVQAPTGSWFADWVLEEATALADSFSGTIRMRTTLEPRIQQIAEESVAAALDENGAAAGASEAAMVVMRPDGAVLAMVGGRDYTASEFNRAVQAKRQPGSAFKLFVYLAALRAGFTPDDRIDDAPIDVAGWQPANYSDRYHGSVTLLDAFERSLNAATVRLGLTVGIEDVLTAARDLGIDGPLEANPSVLLGASEVTLLDITTAYASVLAGSTPVESWGIAVLDSEDRSQTFAVDPDPSRRVSLGPHREPLLRMLRAVVDRGTARQARLDGFAAGKTGTSQYHRDAWFIGFDESLVVGVWVGNDDGSPMHDVTGGSLPALIWREFMSNAGSANVATAPTETELDHAAGVTLSACDIRACSAAYRSFRSSDCTYQPYGGGPRRACTKGEIPITALDPISDDETEPPAVLPAEGVHASHDVGSAPAGCDYRACAARYRSFDSANCTYQPFGGGPRAFCHATEIAGATQRSLETIAVASGSMASAGCNISACAAKYRSFDPASCSYQPYDGSSRRQCAE